MRTPAIVGLTAALAAAGVGVWLLADGGSGGPAVQTEEEAAAEAARGGDPGGAALRAHAPRPVEALTSGRIAVKVADAKGAPAARVRVTARRVGAAHDPADPASWGLGSALDTFRQGLERLDAGKTDSDQPVDAEGRTGEDGTVEIEVKAAGRYETAARPEAPLVGTKTTVTVSAARPRAPASLTVMEGGRLSGRVVDGADRGVAAAVSAVREGDGADPAVPSVRTEATTGAFAFDALPTGTVLLSVHVAGRVTLTGIEVKVPRDAPLVIRLPGGAVVGKVTNGAGELVGGADVVVVVGQSWLGSGSEAPASGTGRGKSGSDGAYRAEGLPAGRVTSVTASAAGYGLLRETAPRAKWSGAAVAEKQDATIDLVLRRTGVVQGKVTEVGSGAPIVGAEVLRMSSGPLYTVEAPEVATTGDDGRYRFEAVPLGKHVVLPRAPGRYFPAAEAAGQTVRRGATSSPPPSALVVLTAEGETAERNLELARGLPISGRVEGPDGAPVAGATVTAVGAGLSQVAYAWGVQGAGEPPLATSAADGTFEGFLAPRDGWVLQARKGEMVGASSDRVSVAAGAPTPSVVLKLMLGASLSGRLLDAEGGPIAGAQIYYWATAGDVSFSADGSNATTGADGSFALTGLPPGRGQVGCYSTAGESTETLDPPLRSGEARTGLTLRFKSTVVVSGTVVDVEGRPVAGRSLDAQAQGTAGGGWSGGATTRADGSFSMRVTPGRWQLTVSDETMEGATTKLGDPIDAPASGLRLVFAPRARAVLQGRVVDSAGSPVPLCLVAPGGRTSTAYGSAHPDEAVAGEFRREVDGPGPWTLRVTQPRDGSGTPLNLRSANVRVEDATAYTTIALESGSEASGTVVGPDGKGVVGVRFASSDGTVSATSDSDGRFRLVGLEREQTVDVAVTAPPRYVAPKTLRAKAGDSRIVLRLGAGAVIVGRVLGPDGAPWAGGSVEAQWKAGAESGVASASLEAGAFRLEGIAQDSVSTLTVRPWSATGGPAPKIARVEGVRAGATDVVVRLDAGVTIEGVVVRADGSPIPDASVNALRTVEKGEAFDSRFGRSGADGAFVVGGLHPGPYRVSVHDAQGLPLADTISVDAPAAGLRIVVAPMVKLVGRLEGPDLAGFTVTAVRAGSTASGGARKGVPANGAFSLDVLPEVDYVLMVSKRDDDRYARFGPAQGGGPEVAISLERGVSIEGVLEDVAGAPQSGWVRAKNEEWTGYGQADSQGRFRIRGLPPGRYGLAPSEVATALVDAEGGATDVRVRRTK